MIFQMIWELKNSNIDTAIDILKKLNKSLFESVNKKVIFERSLQFGNAETYIS